MTHQYRRVPVQNSRCALILNGERLQKAGGDQFTILAHEQIHDSAGKMTALGMTIEIDLDDAGWRLADKHRGKPMAGALFVEFDGQKFPIDLVESDGARTLWLWAGDIAALRGMRQVAKGDD